MGPGLDLPVELELVPWQSLGSAGAPDPVGPGSQVRWGPSPREVPLPAWEASAGAVCPRGGAHRPRAGHVPGTGGCDRRSAATEGGCWANDAQPSPPQCKGLQQYLQFWSLSKFKAPFLNILDEGGSGGDLPPALAFHRANKCYFVNYFFFLIKLK